MSTPKNPKLEGSGIIDCVPHGGLCPFKCNECFYNRPGAWYGGHDAAGNPLAVVPSVAEAEGKVVRMCSGHDASLQRELEVAAAAAYKDVYYCTSVFNAVELLPGPVEVTVNPREEDPQTWTWAWWCRGNIPLNLMSVRVRVAPNKMSYARQLAESWAVAGVPVWLTPMAYWSRKPPTEREDLYEWKVRHMNSYWCPTAKMRREMLQDMPRGVWWCEGACRDCNVCEAAYWLCKRRLQERGEQSV